MIISSLLKMYILLVYPVLLAAVQTLTVDSQLGTSIEDCFQRISIGEQLPTNSIYRNVSELTIRECENICKQNKQCQTYDYGVGAKGNATCNLSNLGEKELRENNLLKRHPDYDVYVRRIQCEQSPPTPLQTQFDDPDDGPGPAHRPVFRPDIDDPKRPLSDDLPSDLRPFETGRPDHLRPIPPYRPHNNYIDHERPDDCDNLKPDYDSPPSYGDHRPQDIPYKPERPHIYQKPERPYYNHSSQSKPDPYDVLYFQDFYGRPPGPYRPYDHGSWRPDPYYPLSPTDDIPDIFGHKPSRPSRPNDITPDTYKPTDKPNYQYIERPNRKPHQSHISGHGDNGYGTKPDKPENYASSPGLYGQSDPDRPSGPLGPPDRPYRPSRPYYDYTYLQRPHDKPNYSYNSQYASGYGQGSNSQDNSIYLEINDPPRPYKPSKPSERPSHNSQGYGQNFGYGSLGSYGYGASYSSQDSYSQSNAQYYGSSQSGYNQDYNRPTHDGIDERPQRPAYGSQNTYYGGSQSSNHHFDESHSSSGGYGSYGSQKPQDNNNYHKPSQGSNQESNYGVSQDALSGYGSQSSQKPQDYHKPGYGSNQGSNYGSNNQDATHSNGYGLTSQKPQGYHKPEYGNSQGSNYGSTNQDVSHSSGYGSPSQKPQDTYHKPAYGSNQGSSYGISQDATHNSGYGSQTSQKPHDHNKPGYNNQGSHQDSYTSSHNSYGNSHTDFNQGYGSTTQSYGGNRPSHSYQSTHGTSNQFHGSSQSYGSSSQSYGGYSGYRPYEDKPYGGLPSYGNKPYDYKPFYDDKRPLHGGSVYDDGNNRPYSSNRPSSTSSQTSYGSTQSNSETDHSDGYQKPAYKPKPNQTDSSYNRPDVKPVYEYEDRPDDVPSYIVRPGGEVVTSRPVAVGDYGETPGYRNPGRHGDEPYKCELFFCCSVT